MKNIFVLAFFVVCGLSLPAQAKPVLLKMPVYVGTNLVGLGSTPKWLAEQVNVAGKGLLKIKLYEPGRLIPPKEILAAVDAGQVTAGFTTPGFNAGVLGTKASIFPLSPSALTHRSFSPGSIMAVVVNCGRRCMTTRAFGCTRSPAASWPPRPPDGFPGPSIGLKT